MNVFINILAKAQTVERFLLIHDALQRLWND